MSAADDNLLKEFKHPAPVIRNPGAKRENFPEGPDPGEEKRKGYQVWRFSDIQR